MPHFFEPTQADLTDLAVACIESGHDAVLLAEDRMPPGFFDLSTRVAGELLHELGKYGVRLAAVVPRVETHSDAFQDFARESNRGNRVRFFATRAEAEAWLGPGEVGG